MNKDNAYSDFCKMIQRSWTYGRMTEEEQVKCIRVLYDTVNQKHLKGTYQIRYGILHAVYNAFLIGLGYTDFNWREESA